MTGYGPGRDCSETGVTRLSCDLYLCFLWGKSGRCVTLPSSSFSAKFKSEWICTYTSPCLFLTWVLLCPIHFLSFFVLIISSSLILCVFNIISSFSFYIHFSFLFCCFSFLLPRWLSWLRHYATNRQVAGSIPDGVIGIFH